MTTAQPSTDLANDFLVLHTYLQAGGPQETALQRLVDLAVSTVPGCGWAAVTAWPERHRPRSLATSSEVAASVDQLQYDLHDGPCLAAAITGDIVRMADLDDAQAWTAFAAAARERTPVRGVMSFHIGDAPDRTALNLYSPQAGAFDADALTIAALFAAQARALLVHAISATKAANLEQALATSRQIGAAIGILMHAHRITVEQAFDLLRTASQRLDRKLRDVALDVTETGELPTRR